MQATKEKVSRGNKSVVKKAPYVLKGMGLAYLKKNHEAIEELREKGMAPPDES